MPSTYLDEMAKLDIGIPKPITMTHGTFATIDNDRNLYTVEGRRNGDATIWDFPGGGRFFAPFPPSHVSRPMDAHGSLHY